MDFDQLRQFERINVVGTSGSGKLTFARTLAAALELPYHEMDALHWKPNWQEASPEELVARVQEVTSGPKWVLDANYSRTTPQKWKHVQLVVWLDTSFVRTVARVTTRTIQRSITRQELWPGTGNRETLSKAFFSRDSVIWWSITTHGKNRRQYAAMMASPEYEHIRFLRLGSPEAVAACLGKLHRHLPSR
jgi:adenylate kinase family enzyme